MSLSFLLRRTQLLRHPVKVIGAAATRPFAAHSLLVLEKLQPVRCLSLSRVLKLAEPAPSNEKEPEDQESSYSGKIKERPVEIIPVETSIRYLQSKAYSVTYGSDPVWKNYRRNFKGGIPPRKTRKQCIRSGKISTGNPCPICRDDYLVLEPENVELLKQFLCPHTGQILSFLVTGLCQRRHKQLLSAIYIAKDRGGITFDVPFRGYNYSEYKK